MLHRLRIIHVLLAAGIAASLAPAQTCLSTLFASNNGGSNGGAVYFDVTVINPIEVVSFQTNTFETVPFTMTVWLTAQGTSAFGNEANPAAWTQVAMDNGTAVGAGPNLPSAVNLAAPFQLAAGSYGMALVMGPQAGHDYTNGTGTNQSYSDANLALSLGSATNVPFTGGIFRPRVWNGSICYNLVPTYCADLTVTGNGQPGTNIDFALTGAEPEAFGILAIGDTLGATTIVIGQVGLLELEIALPFTPVHMGFTDAKGAASHTIRVPQNWPHVWPLSAQGFSAKLTVTPPHGQQPPQTPAARFSFCTSNIVSFQIGG